MRKLLCTDVGLSVTFFASEKIYCVSTRHKVLFISIAPIAHVDKNDVIFDLDL